MRQIVFLLLTATTMAEAAQGSADLRDTQDTALRMGLHESPTWASLLHLQDGKSGLQSQVLSREFFLAPADGWTPRRELLATLAALYEPAPRDPERNVRCRFPARFLWLETRLELPPRVRRCSRLDQWARLDQLNSISLLMISGYFGNPASTFGHSLLKINYGGDTHRSSLLDLGVNYGAVVPEDESTILYVFRGLFGAYEAGFSDQDYYRFDLTYTRTEFRDIWEYELRLTAHQREMLVLHLWEITGKKFRYFFLLKNCAYRLAELVGLAIDRDLTRGAHWWYAPITLFHRLEQIDRGRQKEETMIADTTYVPSAQRVYYAEVQSLKKGEFELLDRILRREGSLDILDGLPLDVQNTVLEALLGYYDYRLAGVLEKDANAQLVAAKNTAIRRRISLPPRRIHATAGVPDRRRPSLSAGPSRASIGYGSRDWAPETLRLEYAPFSYDPIGNNPLEGSSLSLLDMRIAVDKGDGPRIDAVEFVRARKINRNVVELPDEPVASWEIGFGLRQERRQCNDCLEGYLDATVGRSTSIGEAGAATLLIGLDAGTGQNGASGVAHGILATPKSARWGMELSARYNRYVNGVGENLLWMVNFRWSYLREHEIRFSVASDDAGAFGHVSYAYRW